MKTPSALARVSEENGRGNRRAKDDWVAAAEHRTRVTALLLEAGARAEAGAGAEAGGGNGDLVLLGAGNATDVDLDALSQRFESIHLVDLDSAALARAAARQRPEVRAKLQLRGGVDLTGLLDRLDAWKARPPDAAARHEAVAGAVTSLLGRLPGGAAVVASCCLMSQLGWCLELALGSALAGPLELRPDVVALHLRVIAGLLRPGGVGVLINDVTSSERYPLDDLPPETDLAPLAAELVRGQRVIYAAANPLSIGRVLRQDPALAGTFAPPEAAAPWLWRGRAERTYLVYPQILARR